MPIPLSLIVYERGDAGVPTTTYVASLQGRITHYTHTISDRYGFESMTVSLVVRLDEALDWLSNGLMRSVIVAGPDATICWEGLLHTINARIGQKSATVSLDAMGNRVRCKYTTVLGTPGTTATATNTTSTALYGTKDVVTTLDADIASAAANKRDRVLTDRALPRSSVPSETGTGEQGALELELQFVGWFETLKWVVTSRTSTTSTSSTTQVGALLATSGIGIGAVNPFVSADTSDIVSGGPSATEFIEPDTTYHAKIESLLSQGNGGGVPYTWGVYEGRVFRVALAASNTPTVATYFEAAGSGLVLDAGGMVVAPWDVRPNAMAAITNLYDVAPTSGAVDAAARKYVGRVVCTIDEQRTVVQMEPTDTADISTILAAYRKRATL